MNSIIVPGGQNRICALALLQYGFMHMNGCSIFSVPHEFCLHHMHLWKLHGLIFFEYLHSCERRDAVTVAKAK